MTFFIESISHQLSELLINVPKGILTMDINHSLAKQINTPVKSPDRVKDIGQGEMMNGAQGETNGSFGSTAECHHPFTWNVGVHN